MLVKKRSYGAKTRHDLDKNVTGRFTGSTCLLGGRWLIFVNTDMIDRRGMLTVALEVVFLITVLNAPVVSAANAALVKLLEIALRYQVIDVVGILCIEKGVLCQCVLVDSQVIQTNVKL